MVNNVQVGLGSLIFTPLGRGAPLTSLTPGLAAPADAVRRLSPQSPPQRPVSTHFPVFSDLNMASRIFIIVTPSSGP